MIFKEIKDKKKYLEENYPFLGVPKLTDKNYCVHCEQNIVVGDYKVELQYDNFENKEIELIVCPNAPECDGSVIDWIVPE